MINEDRRDKRKLYKEKEQLNKTVFLFAFSFIFKCPLFFPFLCFSFLPCFLFLYYRFFLLHCLFVSVSLYNSFLLSSYTCTIFLRLLFLVSFLCSFYFTRYCIFLLHPILLFYISIPFSITFSLLDTSYFPSISFISLCFEVPNPVLLQLQYKECNSLDHNYVFENQKSATFFGIK